MGEPRNGEHVTIEADFDKRIVGERIRPEKSVTAVTRGFRFRSLRASPPCDTWASAFLGIILVAAAGVATAAPNVTGAWSPVTPWPLIPLHMVLMPDGRVLSFGTKADGTQTGSFIYDVWDPAGGLNGGHLTLDNGTGTDIFCSSTLVLPEGGSVFIAGGDNWTGTGTTNAGNNNSNLFSYTTNTLTRQSNMNRARWYSSSTTLLNGEVYIQGGTGGTDFPEVRATDGTFRLLSGAGTSAFHFQYPRNFVAPDGRVFGYDSIGKMYYVDTTGSGSVTNAGQFSGSHRQRCECRDVPPGPHPAVRRQLQRRRRDRHYGRRAGRDADRFHVVPAPTGERDDSCGRQGAGHRWQFGLEQTYQRQQQRRDLGPDHRQVDGRRER